MYLFTFMLLFCLTIKTYLSPQLLVYKSTDVPAQDPTRSFSYFHSDQPLRSTCPWFCCIIFYLQWCTCNDVCVCVYWHYVCSFMSVYVCLHNLVCVFHYALYDYVYVFCLFVCSPWYNPNGWLGVKHQVTYLFVYILLICMWIFVCCMFFFN